MKAFKGMRVFVVEDDPSLRELLLEELDAEGFTLGSAESAEQAREQLADWQPDMVISDLRLPGESGMDLIPFVKDLDSAPAMLLITAFGSVSQAVEALKRGADDFLTKPLDIEHLLITASRLLSHRRLKVEVQRLKGSQQNEPWHNMLATSRSMRALFQQIQQVSATDASVLILGESG